MTSASACPAPSVNVAILVLPETGPMAPYGLFEVLAAAGGSDGGVRFRPHLVSASGEPMTLGAGVVLTPHASIDATPRPAIVIVCDAELAPEASPQGRWQAETGWLKAQRAGGALVCSACSGALVLAEAGLLDGREAASHWIVANLFRDLYPAVRFRPDRILCNSGGDGSVVTTGGASSWQDLALYLIGRFCGPAEAARISRLFLIGERSEGQLPFAAMAAPRRHEDAAIAEVQAWIADNYRVANPVAGMTARSGLKERTFKRRFAQATGYAPIDYVHALRIEEAKQMLETSVMTVEAVGEAIGYAEPATFIRLFRRLAGVTPAQWRRRFSAGALLKI
jgi:Transcriptional regulator containing an amidase domain and an AraC-type DNA-binding HTH domain